MRDRKLGGLESLARCNQTLMLLTIKLGDISKIDRSQAPCHLRCGRAVGEDGKDEGNAEQVRSHEASSNQPPGPHSLHLSKFVFPITASRKKLRPVSQSSS